MLTKQEASPCVEKEEVKVEVERFIDLARQMEAFFLQKRFVDYEVFFLERSSLSRVAKGVRRKKIRPKVVTTFLL